MGGRIQVPGRLHRDDCLGARFNMERRTQQAIVDDLPSDPPCAGRRAAQRAAGGVFSRRAAFAGDIEIQAPGSNQLVQQIRASLSAQVEIEIVIALAGGPQRAQDRQVFVRDEPRRLQQRRLHIVPGLARPLRSRPGAASRLVHRHRKALLPRCPLQPVDQAEFDFYGLPGGGRLSGLALCPETFQPAQHLRPWPLARDCLPFQVGEQGSSHVLAIAAHRAAAASHRPQAFPVFIEDDVDAVRQWFRALDIGEQHAPPPGDAADGIHVVICLVQSRWRYPGPYRVLVVDDFMLLTRFHAGKLGGNGTMESECKARRRQNTVKGSHCKAAAAVAAGGAPRRRKNPVSFKQACRKVRLLHCATAS